MYGQDPRDTTVDKTYHLSSQIASRPFGYDQVSLSVLTEITIQTGRQIHT